MVIRNAWLMLNVPEKEAIDKLLSLKALPIKEKMKVIKMGEEVVRIQKINENLMKEEQATPFIVEGERTVKILGFDVSSSQQQRVQNFLEELLAVEHELGETVEVSNKGAEELGMLNCLILKNVKAISLKEPILLTDENSSDLHPSLVSELLKNNVVKLE